MRRVEVLDLGLGNVLSVVNMFEYIGAEAVPVIHPEDCDPTSLLVLPGVGAFDTGMKALDTHDWASHLKARHYAGQPLLGVCLGMQLLCDSSDEGARPGLGLIPGHFQHLGDRSAEQRLKVPHMGWSPVFFDRSLAPWTPDPEQENRYYFVHSYHYTHENDDFLAGWCEYGGRVAAMITSEQTTGMQFHPEKSHRFGAELLSRYLGALDV